VKRFWDLAAVSVEPGGFGIVLDGKPLRVPSGPPLLVPNAELALAIAGEWQAAGTESRTMDYSDVPLTRLAGTAQVRIAPDPAPTAAAIAAYGESDLLCYRADTPLALVEREDAAWQPWLDWARIELGAALTVTAGIVYVRQHPAALAALRRAVDAEDGWVLAGLGILVPALGSLVLGLAVARGALSAEEAAALSILDDTFQAELWGEDAEAAARRANIAADVAQAARFIGLCRA
jgi:chaperone required for assembly of F1-ATPase